MRMNELPEELFANPTWHALHSKHREFAKCAGDACRYPADVGPLAAIGAPGVEPMLQLSRYSRRLSQCGLLGRSTRRLRDSFAKKL